MLGPGDAWLPQPGDNSAFCNQSVARSVSALQGAFPANPAMHGRVRLAKRAPHPRPTPPPGPIAATAVRANAVLDPCRAYSTTTVPFIPLWNSQK
jgi:hypothetical protein